MVSPLLIIFLQERLGASVETLAWAYFPSALVWALLPSRLGALADRVGRKPLMVLGLVAAAAGSFFLPSLSSVLAFAALWAVLALCFAAGDPAEQALVADLTGYDRRGRAYGFYAMANDLGATIGPFGGAWLYQQFGASAPFYANSLLLALCALLLVFFLHLPAGQVAGDMPV
jgi:MFS family permease